MEVELELTSRVRASFILAKVGLEAPTFPLFDEFGYLFISGMTREGAAWLAECRRSQSGETI